MSKIVLVVAAHSDDEVLGCAGTIARHVDNGDTVHLLFMTDGVGARDSGSDHVVERRLMSQMAAETLGVESVTYCNFPDNQMDTIPLIEVVQSIEKEINQLMPEIIYTHHIGDLNVDHQLTHKAVITACRPQPDFCVKEIYAFEVLSSTEWSAPYVCDGFNPNMYVDITEFYEKKVQALHAYEQEMREYPHSRSVKGVAALCQYRGISVGVEMAEAFQIVRIIL